MPLIDFHLHRLLRGFWTLGNLCGVATRKQLILVTKMNQVPSKRLR